MKLIKTAGLVVIMLTLLIAPLPAAAKKEEEREPGIDAISGAIINDDEQLSALISKADGCAGRGDLKQAARLYVKAISHAIDNDRDLMHRVEGETEDGMIFYRPVLGYCRQRLLAMGPKTLARVLGDFEDKAAAALKEAIRNSDSAATATVGARYEFTKSGFTAVVLAGDIAVERGDFVEAARLYSQALEVRGVVGMDGCEEYAALIAKAACSYHRLERRRDLAGLKKLLSADAQLAATEISVAGRKISLSAYLEGLSLPAETHTSRPVPAYPTLGGNEARSRLMEEPSGKIGKVVWRRKIEHNNKLIAEAVMLARDAWRRKIEHDNKPRKEKKYDLPARFNQILVGPVPVFYGENLFVNTGHSLLALKRADGQAAYEAPSLLGIQKRRSSIDVASAEFCLIYDGLIFATKLGSVQSAQMIRSARALCAIDLRTGEELWDTKSEKVFYNEGISTSPAYCRGDLIFETWKPGRPPSAPPTGPLHKSVSSGQRKYFLNCLDAKTGKLKWRTFLAGSVFKSFSLGWSSDILALDDGTAVLYSTSGVIAAVDIETGVIKWIAKYRADYGKRLRKNKVKLEDMAKYWCINSPITHKGNVIISPRDSSWIYCLDVQTGEIQWEVDMLRLSYLAGIDDGKLFIVADRLVVFDVRTGKVLHRSKVKFHIPLGRPALTKKALYISTKKSLFRYDRATKKIGRLFDWEDHEMFPGNLLCTKERLFVASFGEIVAFSAGEK